MKENIINIIKAINALSGIAKNGCRIVSLTYQGQPKKQGDIPDIARYTLLCGVNLERAYKNDIAKLESRLPRLLGVDKIACEEMIESKRKSLQVGIGNNPAFNQVDLYESLEPGLRVNKDTGKVHVYGFQIKREVITKGVYQPVNSSAKTLAKKKLAKGLATERFRAFVVDSEQLQRVAANGKVVTL